MKNIKWIEARLCINGYVGDDVRYTITKSGDCFTLQAPFCSGEFPTIAKAKKSAQGFHAEAQKAAKRINGA